MSCRFHCWCWSWNSWSFREYPFGFEKVQVHYTTVLPCRSHSLHFLTHYYICMQFCITLYGYEKVQVGYTLWSIDFTVRHVNLIRSAIHRFHCLMCVSMTSTVFKLSFHLLFYICSYLTYNTKDLFPSSAYNVYVFYNLCFSMHF